MDYLDSKVEPHVSLLHDLIFVLYFAKALPLAFAGSVDGLTYVVSIAAEKKNSLAWVEWLLLTSHVTDGQTDKCKISKMIVLTSFSEQGSTPFSSIRSAKVSSSP